ncbi:ATP-dependent RNA helicase DDX10/DBP4 [Nematocida sp. AWRm77]|nr:ATP-dependent RNA helicase DDX10/DBP4 [Nematocida sp. AWRm77]
MRFDEYNLYPVISKALRESKFEEATLVQKRVVPAALSGKSLVCSAKTGTGKTLAFVIPVLQRLLAQKWDRTDGLGGIIITPTRELALQVFEVLKSVGKYTNLSGGLLIGGRNAEKEKKTVATLNVIVCTPGRLLEHLESVWNFSGDNLQVLVIDEADKLMEMGFRQTIERILEYVSAKRQTLLFSATVEAIAKAKSVWDIDTPEIITVEDESVQETGSACLVQEVLVVTPAQKFDLLYRVIKEHLKKRVIVFLSTCKEVTFFYTLFKSLRLGVPLLYLNGNMALNKRIETYHKFSKNEPKMLFSTDIAARGLDFPNIDLVLQLDAPDSKETYIHRVGRTARNGAKGKGILAVLPREEGLLKDLRGVPGFPEEKVFRSSRSIADRVQSAIRHNSEIYLLAQKYIKTYKGFLRVLKKEYVGCAAQGVTELAEFLGVEEDENVSWSGRTKKKSKLLSSRVTFD